MGLLIIKPLFLVKKYMYIKIVRVIKFRFFYIHKKILFTLNLKFIINMYLSMG